MQVMIDIVSLQLMQTRRLPFQANPIVCIFSLTGELDKWNSDDPTPLNEGCEFSLRGCTCMEIENAAAKISNLPRDEDENQDADRHQGNNCVPGDTHVFSST